MVAAFGERFHAIDEHFDRVDDRFAAIDRRFDTIEGQLRDLKSEVADISKRRTLIEGTVAGMVGYAKEIDGLAQRIRAIENHLGIERELAASAPARDQSIALFDRLN